jgi:hypothetical protein
MPSVLIDQNIMSYGDIMMFTKIDGVIGYVRKKPPVDGTWLREEFKCLPTIAKLIKNAEISAYRYIELDLEDWKRNGSGSSSKLGDLFPNSEMGEIEPAIERSYFFQTNLLDYLDTSSVVDFCNWLNVKGVGEHALKNRQYKNFPESMKSNLENISRYQEMCRTLQKEEQYIDAFHLWTGETNNIDYFLTADKKFINAIKNSNSKCKPVLPSQLLKYMGISEIEPFDFQENVFYGIGGQHMWEIA